MLISAPLRTNQFDVHRTVFPLAAKFKQLPPLTRYLSLPQPFSLHQFWLPVQRALSALFWLGPWRAYVIRYFQRHNRNHPMPRMPKSLFVGVNINQTVTQLETAGFAPGLQLPESQIETLLSYCAQRNLPRYKNPHLDCAVMHAIVHDPTLLAVARQYFGAEPRLYSSQIYWTGPTATSVETKKKQQSRFHYDVGDFKALEIFIYLTDVDTDCGPHVVIPGTHKRQSLARYLTRYLDNREAEQRYGTHITTVIGKRGTGFIENTVCYHRHSAGIKPRLMLSFSYVLQRKSARLRGNHS